MKMRAFRCTVAALLLAMAAFPAPSTADSAPFWIYYDNGNPWAGSGADFQGVRYSLPAGMSSAKLSTIQVRATRAGDLTFYVTQDDHQTALADPIDVYVPTYDPPQQYDVSHLGIIVPHDFYLVVDCADSAPTQDDAANVGRSFRGSSLATLTETLTYNLMLRVEVDPPIFADGFEDGNDGAWSP